MTNNYTSFVEPTTAFLAGLSSVIGRSFRNIVTRRYAARLMSLFTLLILGLTPGPAHASRPYDDSHAAPTQQLTSIAVAPNGGFWVLRDKFEITGFGGQRRGLTKQDGELVSIGGAPVTWPAYYAGSIAAIPGRNAYWIVTWYGSIINRGDAPALCGGNLTLCSGFEGGEPGYKEMIVAAAARPQGDGLWAVSRKGQVWTAGNARSYGDVQHQSHPVTGIVATPSGNGYYIVAEDGGVFSFGDAVFLGSTGGNPPGGRKITGMALSILSDGQVNGYWLVGEDGGVHAMGGALFWGSTGGNDGGSPVTNIVSFPAPVPGQPPQATKGYAWVHKDGRVGQARNFFP
jgi:hypothetical protein